MQYAAEVPAYLRDPSLNEGMEAFSGGIGGQRGPHVTVKNGQFFLVGIDDNPRAASQFDQGRNAMFFDMVVAEANPGLAKVYYSTGYTEGSSSPPDCWSNDGREPDASIAAPESHECGACPKNAFGSLITAAGKQVKACSDRKRLAVLSVGEFSQGANGPMSGPIYEFSVSPSNLKSWNEYVTNMKGRGIPLRGVVTRVYTDPTRQGGMIFEPATPPGGVGIWFVPENFMNVISFARQSDEARKAIGTFGVTQRPLLAAPTPTAQIGYAPTSTAIAQAVEPTGMGGQDISGGGLTNGFAASASQETGAATTEEAGRRKRRTKAEIARDNAAAQAVPAGGPAVPNVTAPTAPYQQPPTAFAQAQAQPVQQAFGQPAASSAPSSFGAQPAVSQVAPSNGNPFGNPGSAAPVTAGFGTAPAAQPQAQFGVVTNPGIVPAEVDAMLASVMGTPQ